MMEKDIINKQYTAKVEAINYSDGQLNLLVVLEDGNKMNFKADLTYSNQLIVNCIYLFKVAIKINSERNSAHVVEFQDVSKLADVEKKDLEFRKFLPQAHLSLLELEKRINVYLEKIENKVMYEITKSLLKDYRDDFFLFPAAQKFHHAYVGGLASHTLGMLDLIDGFLKNYDYLDSDYLYAGAILHDLGKTIEFTGLVNTEYGLEGQLLGHLVIGSQLINKKAAELGYEDTEEVLILSHMIISHHGQLAFGSAKKPATAEALLLWYIDTLDSKFRVLGEELDKISEGEFTEGIAVLERMKFYKTKKNKKVL